MAMEDPFVLALSRRDTPGIVHAVLARAVRWHGEHRLPMNGRSGLVYR